MNERIYECGSMQEQLTYKEKLPKLHKNRLFGPNLSRIADTGFRKKSHSVGGKTKYK